MNNIYFHKTITVWPLEEYRRSVIRPIVNLNTISKYYIISKSLFCYDIYKRKSIYIFETFI